MDNQETRALIAGTLALMTRYAESRCPEGGARWSLLENDARTSADRAAVRH